jgi:hypothetical protein
MAETVEPRSEHEETQKSKRTDPKSFTRVVLIIIALYAILIAVAIYHPHLNERVKFATENGLSLAILIAVVAQVLIYREQWYVMQWQSRIAEQSLIAGERAFVYVSFDTLPNVDMRTSNVIGYRITPHWYNSGKTPTRHMVNHVSYYIFNGKMPDDWEFPDLWHQGAIEKDKIPSLLTLAPNSSVRGPVFNISAEQLRDVIDGDKEMVIWGWAKYNDVFPNTRKHITRFAVRLFAAGFPLRPETMSFRFNFLPVYNCSDDECDSQNYPVKA